MLTCAMAVWISVPGTCAVVAFTVRTATATRLQVAGAPRAAPEGMVAVPVRVRTRLFGTLRLSFVMKAAEAKDEGRFNDLWQQMLSLVENGGDEVPDDEPVRPGEKS